MNRRWLLIIVLLVSVGVVAAILLSRLQVLAAPDQPISYSHRTHVQAGLQCLYCHTSALRSDIAGIPSLEKCMGCHSLIATDNTTVQTMAGYWQRGEPIPWTRVSKQPEFVYFSHQIHLKTGENCETCHGDIGRMSVTSASGKMDMGWCLDCHLKQPEDKIARLADCLTCHK